MYKLILFLACCIFSTPDAIAQVSKQLNSPDGNIQFIFHLSNGGELGYSISYKQKPIVLSSKLGLNGWEKGFSLSANSVSRKDTVWKPVYGERSSVRDHYEELVISLLLNNNDRRKLQIQIRAYNEGVAFRYTFPEHSTGGTDILISKDLTEYALPADTRAWVTDRAQGEYNLLDLKDWPSETERPLTLQLKNGTYVSLAEAQVVDYCRTKFALDPVKPNTITCAMFDKVELTTPFSTPWHVVMIADKATQLLQNNDIILNLNEPSAIQHPDWIKPGKIMREISLSTSGAKELVDFAAKRRLQYIHFDAGWYGYEYTVASDASAVNVDPRRNPKNDLNLQEVIQYAKQKGIGVFLYVNQRALVKQLDTLLPLFEKWGVAGIKFGFVHVGSHRWTQWLHEAIKKCAKHHLMVDIHDEYRPTGFSRTYPNLLTQEGVRGNEEMPAATNSTILPFTRLIAGAADHTICYYHRPELKPRLAETQNARIMKTTSGHQLALAVVLFSPLQFMYWYDKPADSKDEPELEFFDRVPTVWDDTKVLDGEPGQFVSIARRSNNEWFLGTVTNVEAREVNINFSFLAPGKKYKATIYYDDPTSKIRTKVSMKQIEVNTSTILKEDLVPSGGLAIWIRPN